MLRIIFTQEVFGSLCVGSFLEAKGFCNVRSFWVWN